MNRVRSAFEVLKLASALASFHRVSIAGRYVYPEGVTDHRPGLRVDEVGSLPWDRRQKKLNPERVAASLVLIALAIGGCGGPKAAPTTSAAHKAAPADPWVLTCLDPNEPEPALLWNGQIGVRIGRDGTGSGPMFLVDEYDTRGEEKIKPIQNPISAVLFESSNELANLGGGRWGEITGYSQTLDMRTGILTTKWKEPIATESSPKRSVAISCETAISPNSRVVVQRWTLVATGGAAQFDVEPGITGGRELTPKKRTWGTEWDLDDSLSYLGLKGDVDLMWSVRRRDLSSVVTQMPYSSRGQVSEGKPFVTELIWSLSPSSKSSNTGGEWGHRKPSVKNPAAQAEFPDVPESHWAYKDLVRPTFEEVATTSKAAWAKRWQTDAEIEGPVEDQQAVRSFLFYLGSAIDPAGKMSISPYGLSSSTYNGHVFWDADIWVFPALALIEPDEAKAIANYRISQRGQALKNFLDWFEKGRPTASGKLGMPPMGGEASGVKYPWESSVTGRETVLGPSQFEDHITGDVAWMIDQAASLGLVTKAQRDTTLVQAGDYYNYRSEGKRDSLEIKGTMSPDENHVGDNDLYTNLLAQWCLNGGRLDVAGAARPRLKLPRDDVSFLTYDNDALRSYKQAAAVLSIYPLQYPAAEKESKVMMDRFAGKVSKNGPAMSDSLHALIWARLGETDKAYDTWEMSWRDFVKGSFLLFSEKRNKTSNYFTTGAAGCLQTVLYGFLGFRIDSKKQDGAQWSTPLALGKILSVRPNLPRSWKSVKFKNFIVNGHRYTLTATHQGVTVTQGDR